MVPRSSQASFCICFPVCEMGSQEHAAQDGAWQVCLLLPWWGDLPRAFVMAEETEAREVKQGNRVNGTS